METRKRETYVRSQSFSSESERKIQISPSLGEQDQSNALPQGQQRQIPTPPIPPPPRRPYNNRCINRVKDEQNQEGQNQQNMNEENVS